MAESHEALERFEHAEEHGHGGPLAKMAALTVAIVAAFLAVSSFLGNEAAQDAVQGQTRAAIADNQSQIFDTQDEVFQVLQSELIVLGNSSDSGLATTAKAVNKKLESDYSGKIEEHQKELGEKLKEIKKDVAHANDQHRLYEIAEVLLQIGIVLASVSIIASRRFLLIGGQAVAIAGVVVLIIGYIV